MTQTQKSTKKSASKKPNGNAKSTKKSPREPRQINRSDVRASLLELIAEAQRLAKSAKSPSQYAEAMTYLRSAHYRARQLSQWHSEERDDFARLALLRDGPTTRIPYAAHTAGACSSSMLAEWDL